MNTTEWKQHKAKADRTMELWREAMESEDTSKQIWREIAETRLATIKDLRALCTFFQILAGGLTVALVSVLVL